MNVRVNNQAATAVVTKNRSSSLSSTIKRKYESFQAPFSERRALLVMVDSLLVLLAAGGAFVPWQLRTGRFFDVSYVLASWYMFPAVLGGWWILAWLNDLYDIPSSVDKALTATRVAVVGVLALPIYLVVYFLVPPHFLPRVYFLSFLGMVLIAIMTWRWTYAVLFTNQSFGHRVLIVGNNERGRSIASVLQQWSRLNYNVLGYVAEDSSTPGISRDGMPVVGRNTDLPYLVKHLQIHEVIVAIERHLDANLFQLLIECQARGVRISLMADLYEQLYRRIPIEYIDPDWALQVIQGKAVFSRIQLLFKRLSDIVLAVMGIVILTPFLPVVALAIRLDSPGPIFYRQIRCGRAGKPFYVFKFRTMCSDAEKDGQARWATENDDRITRVGRLLRKTRLDETPQLLNILLGEMSVVGPRPERPEFVTELQQAVPFYYSRLMVKPGLTGWAQVNYDYGNSVKDALIKLQYDFYYLRYWSLWLDLYIIFRTFAVVFKLKGT